MAVLTHTLTTFGPQIWFTAAYPRLWTCTWKGIYWIQRQLEIIGPRECFRGLLNGQYTLSTSVIHEIYFFIEIKFIFGLGKKYTEILYWYDPFKSQSPSIQWFSSMWRSESSSNKSAVNQARMSRKDGFLIPCYNNRSCGQGSADPCWCSKECGQCWWIGLCLSQVRGLGSHGSSKPDWLVTVSLSSCPSVSLSADLIQATSHGVMFLELVLSSDWHSIGQKGCYAFEPE